MTAPFNNLGYSSAPWTVTQAAGSITWSSETFAQNQNANAIRWGTLYNFRFDADQPPQNANAMVGYFKTGSPTHSCDPGTFRGRLTNSDTNRNRDRYSHSHAYGNTDRDGNSNCDCYSDCDG